MREAQRATYLPRILETQPLDTCSILEMSQGRAPECASSTIFCRVWSGRGRPLTNTPPSWFTPLCPGMDGGVAKILPPPPGPDRAGPGVPRGNARYPAAAGEGSAPEARGIAGYRGDAAGVGREAGDTAGTAGREPPGVTSAGLARKGGNRDGGGGGIFRPDAGVTLRDTA